MFSTKGSSSYGKGIASNLVTEEERVKYNSGGRVGYYTDYRGGPVRMGGLGDPIPEWWNESWGPILQHGDRGLIWDPDANNGMGSYVKGDSIYEARGSGLGEEKMDYIPRRLGDIEETASQNPVQELRGSKRSIPRLKDLDIDYMKGQAGSKRDALERSMGYDIGTPVEGDDFAGTSFNVTPTKADRVFGEPRQNLLAKVDTESLGEEEVYDPGALMPQLSPYLQAKKDVAKGTDLPPPVEKEEGIWEYLDKRSDAARKRGLGKGLMDAAAAAVEWSGAGTKKEKAAAISKGLTGMGEAGTKYVSEADKLKDITKIQEHIEGVKSAGKIDLQTKKQEGRMDELAEAYKLSDVSKTKMATLKNKFAEDMKEYDLDRMTPGLEYKAFMLKNNYNPKAEDKAFALSNITGENVLPPPKDDKTRKNYLATPGVIFVDEDRIIYKVSKDGIADPVTEKILGLGEVE